MNCRRLEAAGSHSPVGGAFVAITGMPGARAILACAPRPSSSEVGTSTTSPPPVCARIAAQRRTADAAASLTRIVAAPQPIFFIPLPTGAIGPFPTAHPCRAVASVPSPARPALTGTLTRTRPLEESVHYEPDSLSTTTDVRATRPSRLLP